MSMYAAKKVILRRAKIEVIQRKLTKLAWMKATGQR